MNLRIAGAVGRFMMASLGGWMLVGGLLFPSALLAAPPSKPVGDSISLGEFRDLLLERNLAIKAAKVESRITATGIEQAEGRFQPQLKMSLIKGETNEVNSPEDKATRGDTEAYERRYTDLNNELSMLLPSGGTVGLQASLSRFWSTSFETYSSDPALVDKDRTRATYGLQFEQPLLRDRGSEVTQAPLEIAKLESEIARLAADDAKALSLGEGVNIFYDLLIAQYERDAALKKVQMAQDLLDSARQLESGGRIDSSAVADVEISLAQLQTSLIEAEQAVRDSANLARKLLLLDPVSSPGRFEVVAPLPEIPESLPANQQILQEALSQRADYRAQQIQVEREGAEQAYHRNQLLPRLDAKVNYGYSGLALQNLDAYSSDYRAADPTWSVGLSLEVPLGRDKEKSARLEASRLKQQQARDELAALATEIANDLDTAIGLVESATARWQLWQEVFQREQAKHAREQQRFTAGRSDLRTVLLSHERLINTELQLRNQQVAYLRARQLLAITRSGELAF